MKQEDRKEFPFGQTQKTQGMEYYRQLVYFEQEITQKMMLRQLEAQEIGFRQTKQRGKLQIHFSNTLDRTNGSWTFFVDGSLSDGERKYPLTAFFKKILIEIKAGGEKELVEWSADTAQRHSGMLAVKRNTKLPAETRIFFQKKESCYAVSGPLSSVIGLEAGTRPQVVYAVWKYIKVNRLPENCQTKAVTLDEKLRAVFETSEASFSSLPGLVLGHLTPQNPLQASYTVPEGVERNTDSFVHEIDVEFEDTARFPLGFSSSVIRETVDMNVKAEEIIRQIEDLEAKQTVLREFAEDPRGMIDRWVLSQAEDISDELGETELDEALLGNTDALLEQIRRYCAA
ncbi:MAG: SWI/SNF and RSC complex component Snf12/Ssr3 [Amphiamblys sp. WSBS2006]|nr:MAG: SWI/SNF and RSC complex component Snf12/Ssr3 [Amphiamblys sp. WSBS2006]